MDADPEASALLRALPGIRLEIFDVSSVVEARRVLQQTEVDVLLLDVALPQNGGLTLLSEVMSLYPKIDIVVTTGFANAATAMQAMRGGASDYLTKPISEDDLVAVLERAGQRLQRDLESRRLRERLRTDKGMGPLIGTSPGMERVYRILSKVALSRHPALILGESGTGKEIVARAIHSMSSSATKTFVVVDCAGLSAASIEDELFGHVKGAVAGARRAKDGLLIAAGEGTVFLDEVGELPLDLQSKLLRILQEKQVRPLGGAESIPFAARVLAASSGDLMARVEQGQFRKDLYFRLNVVKLAIPPLRERREDIPMLAQHFLDAVQRERGGSCSFSDEALRLVCEYDWPGNVRELQSAVERTSAMSSGPVLQTVDLPTQLQDFQEHLRAGAAVAEDEPAAEGPSVVSIAEMEKQAILSTIRQLNGDKLLAAKLLGIGKTTLYRKLKEYGEEG
ncbi:MAG TPA: sigma-54 dependent transcriptional regulator [Acidobacteriaceae bacterium]|nr:sigma-54 dependent transcriptional regulator [Acidobacteriaceae bacterium]